MGNNISDIIERYLKRILQQSQSGVIEVQRSELAELFQCVPSQINYVISTRFSVDHGYIVESKRGGGGYIRIRRIDLDEHAPLVTLVRSMGSTISQREAESVIDRLLREQVVTEREAAMLRAAIRREVLNVDLPYRDELRARLMTQMLLALSAVVQRAEDDAKPQR
ncbi:MAG: CtsR family transcriptional regulator [Alicyclobacillus macrosporangiidus]|uniref:CtsR family transcriptional regulator n=1 Tax=Alicyclobacillus macrosporangiidus TaxID=392015 RepID=UPI0026F1E717|nr:CtsR family transcriptional regulator [Alicyclobacillus macrosporangiidus]MCL6600508.1 CtsR family transcriptional regulator [Alicyclobacillus macrosporangiidus]